MKISIFWFRRDLRLEDNTALFHALNSDYPVLPVFIFDQNILKNLPADDPRVSFIYTTLQSIISELRLHRSTIKLLFGDPKTVWEQLITTYDIGQVYINKDYEPYARDRDARIKLMLSQKDIILYEFKDQVIFEENEIIKDDGEPYTVYTPYKNKWLRFFDPQTIKPLPSNDYSNLYPADSELFLLSDIGFHPSHIEVRSHDLSVVGQYAKTRDMPAMDTTSYLSPHLRFGTISIRQVISHLHSGHEVFLSELIWREFFMQILFHFPQVIDQNFKEKYNGVIWRNNEEEFELWCQGKTGYPLVDAGMRQLNLTGYMHNRVRMITAGFLCKHLLIDWRWGEAYFAKKLLDYELSSNNGNWQWAAGTGCDAAPYFRIFNPSEQLKKFDGQMNYIKKWLPEYDSSDYMEPIIDHKFARQRTLNTYRTGMQNRLM